MAVRNGDLDGRTHRRVEAALVELIADIGERMQQARDAIRDAVRREAERFRRDDDIAIPMPAVLAPAMRP